MRIISFNLEGIQKAKEKGFFTWVAQQDADIICLQNTNADEYQIETSDFNLKDYEPYCFSAIDPTVGGVVIYSRIPPKAIIRGLGFELADNAGCYVQADFDKVSIASLLLPNAASQQEGGLNNKCSLADKQHFLTQYAGYLEKQKRKRREFLICGSWYIAHQKIDVADWRTQQEQSGFLLEERNWLSYLNDEIGLLDTYREVDREAGKYSWWPSVEAKEENQGCRYDYTLATQGMRHTVLNAGIYTGQAFSNHAPVIVDYDWELMT
ncbi:exodeoxyribonuclease III [Spartinivicinus poritis]|uniref:Exodeoxyribonuclease III n=1 Tax=Spartinivicinus poritis TaxID=2994640 RepID=A0ABT5UC60_9GAMM|nr:exodeoxyribonuclease III [Spartinivicinus sp. A2-2]MDE1463576.1 exodeoxyribonuclease III [Spartinivicinus sp. A2-2]